MDKVWQEMKPGRELDWLVAEKAGWTYKREGRFFVLRRPDGSIKQSGIDTEASARLFAPRFSTELDAAFLLIHRMSWSIDNDGYVASVGLWNINSSIAYDEPKQIAFAICRAWLAWKES